MIRVRVLVCEGCMVGRGDHLSRLKEKGDSHHEGERF
jgi:hypothetical protein